MNGKSKCKLLKQIRQEIAQSNNIAYVTSQCQYQGDCTGTCPKCEAEVQYLEAELQKRRQAGKAVAVAGVAAALMVSMSACQTQAPPSPSDTQPPPSEHVALEGSIPTPSIETVELMGEVPAPTEEAVEIMGDIDLSDGVLDLTAPPSE